MIKHIFAPEYFGNYCLFKKKTLGFTISPNTIHATSLTTKAHTTTITNSFTQTIDQDSKLAQSDKITAALKAIIAQAGRNHEITASLDSSLVLFKELSFPLLTEEKIRLILPLEIERFLPYPLHEAVFDFVITNRSIEEKRTDIMVAAVQKKYVQEYCDSFLSADIPLKRITLDILNLYHCLPKLHQIIQNNLLVLSDGYTVHVAYQIQGKLKKIRILNSSLSSDNFLPLFTSTVNSLAQELGKPDTIQCFGAFDNAIIKKINSTLNIDTQFFSSEKIITLLELQNTAPNSFENTQILSLFAAYTSTGFNLLENKKQENMRLFKQQIIATTILTTLIFSIFTGHTLWQTIKLSQAIDERTEITLKKLKTNFTDLKKGGNLKQVLSNAKKELEQKEAIWYSFSEKAQQSYLAYLHALSTKIDREFLSLQLKRMTIHKNQLLIEGNVKNNAAIAEFEKCLKQTKLFVSVPSQQNTDFAITLQFNHVEEHA